MKNLRFLFTFLAIVLIPFQGNSQKKISGNGNVTSQTRDLSGFTAICISNGIDVEITQGQSEKVVVEADENVIDYIKTEVHGNVLKIYSKKQIENTKARCIYLTAKNINNIEASGGSDVCSKNVITADNFIAKMSGGSDLELNADTKNFSCTLSGGSDAEIDCNAKTITVISSGGSDIEMENISANRCDIIISGGSDARLNGEVNELIAIAKGGSDLSADDLSARDCKLELSGGSDAYVNISASVEVKARSSCDVVIAGNPSATDIDTDKSSDVRIL